MQRILDRSRRNAISIVIVLTLAVALVVVLVFGARDLSRQPRTRVE